LKSKQEAFQKEVLGKGRFKLWQSEKANLKEMVGQRDRPVQVQKLNSATDNAMLAGMKISPQPATALPGQKQWDSPDYDRPDLRKIPPEHRINAPSLLPSGSTQDEAVHMLENALGFDQDSVVKRLISPIEHVTIKKSDLPHTVEKRTDARERYGLYLEPTITNPYEIWRTQYDDGSYRHRYIAAFTGNNDLMIVVKIEPNGCLFWNYMQREGRKMNKLREGELVYKK
jgi:phage-Barnase-EndoU-ColicinE5/D-RelE like nuclease2